MMSSSVAPYQSVKPHVGWKPPDNVNMSNKYSPTKWQHTSPRDRDTRRTEGLDILRSAQVDTNIAGRHVGSDWARETSAPALFRMKEGLEQRSAEMPRLPPPPLKSLFGAQFCSRSKHNSACWLFPTMGVV